MLSVQKTVSRQAWLWATRLGSETIQVRKPTLPGVLLLAIQNLSLLGPLSSNLNASGLWGLWQGPMYFLFPSCLTCPEQDILVVNAKSISNTDNPVHDPDQPEPCEQFGVDRHGPFFMFVTIPISFCPYIFLINKRGAYYICCPETWLSLQQCALKHTSSPTCDPGSEFRVLCRLGTCSPAEHSPASLHFKAVNL